MGGLAVERSHAFEAELRRNLEQQIAIVTEQCRSLQHDRYVALETQISALQSVQPPSHEAALAERLAAVEASVKEADLKERIAAAEASAKECYAVLDAKCVALDARIGALNLP